MYVCMCVFVCVYRSISICLYIYMYVCMYVNVFMCFLYVRVCIHAHAHLHTCKSLSDSMYACLYGRMSVYLHIMFLGISHHIISYQIIPCHIHLRGVGFGFWFGISSIFGFGFGDIGRHVRGL